jgi:murein DD-endopeptidase MepM/ murein hydrolase activator NlpD
VRQEAIDDFGYANKYLNNLRMPIRLTRVSSKFGPRRGRMHNGIDFPAPRGTPVFAAHDGEVIHSGHFNTGYGITVLIRDGNFITVYSHLSDTLLTKGRRVKAGDPIGEVGATGNATGNHLHFETRIIKDNGKSVPIDPEKFLRIN